VNTRTVVTALVVAGLSACQSKPEAAKMEKPAEAAPAAPAAAPAKVEITEPANGAEVTSPVKIVLQTTGVEIVAATDERPGTGHHHLFVDHDVTPAGDTIPKGVTGIIHLGRGQTDFLDTLKAGKHRIIDVVGDSKHIPLSPMVADTVEFTVKAATATTKKR
jgi:uncharacterized protein DUF4399